MIGTTHVEERECHGPGLYTKCYPIINLSDDQFHKEDLRGDITTEEWARYQTAEELGIKEHKKSGELSNYPNNGYFLQFDPETTTQESYL